jgi:hypothetical protein
MWYEVVRPILAENELFHSRSRSRSLTNHLCGTQLSTSVGPSVLCPGPLKANHLCGTQPRFARVALGYTIMWDPASFGPTSLEVYHYVGPSLVSPD